MASPGSTQAQGIRADVAEPPFWMRQLIERPLVHAKIVQVLAAIADMRPSALLLSFL